MKTGFEGLNESAKKNKTWAPNSWWIWKFLADMFITFLELLFRCLDLDPNNAKMLYFQVKNKKRTPSEVQQNFFWRRFKYFLHTNVFLLTTFLQNCFLCLDPLTCDVPLWLGAALLFASRQALLLGLIYSGQIPPNNWRSVFGT